MVLAPSLLRSHFKYKRLALKHLDRAFCTLIGFSGPSPFLLCSGKRYRCPPFLTDPECDLKAAMHGASKAWGQSHVKSCQQQWTLGMIRISWDSDFRRRQHLEYCLRTSEAKASPERLLTHKGIQFLQVWCPFCYEEQTPAAPIHEGLWPHLSDQSCGAWGHTAHRASRGEHTHPALRVCT